MLAGQGRIEHTATAELNLFVARRITKTRSFQHVLRNSVLDHSILEERRRGMLGDRIVAIFEAMDRASEESSFIGI